MEDNETTPKKKERVKVRLLNTSVYDECYLVVTPENEAYLVPTDKLQFSLYSQTIDKHTLDRCARPYDWRKEVQAIMPSVESIVLSLWAKGLIERSDANNRSKIRQALIDGFPRSLRL